MDRRWHKTQKAIRQAYFSLIAERSNRITVAEIARRANIDRKTFYLHYSVPEDVLQEFTHERMQELRHILEEKGFFRSSFHIRTAFQALSELLQEDEDLYRNIANREYDFLWDEVGNVFRQTVYDLYRDQLDITDQEALLMLEFYTGGIISSYRHWLRGGLQMDLDEVADRLASVSLYGVENYLLNQEGQSHERS